MTITMKPETGVVEVIETLHNFHVTVNNVSAQRFASFLKRWDGTGKSLVRSLLSGTDWLSRTADMDLSSIGSIRFAHNEKTQRIWARIPKVL